eukprot:302963_1
MCQTMRNNHQKEFAESELKDNIDHETPFDEIKNDFDDFDDGDQEVQVNADDLREKAVGCSIKNQNIIVCIGKIRTTYIASDGTSKNTNGTGTVYKVIDGFAYVITCAHNLRLTEYWQCNECNQRNKRRKCSNINCKSLNSTAHILKAGKVYFQRRKLENGDKEQEYKFDKDAVYINDNKYSELPLAKSGYDIAILKFKDLNDYYKG